MESEYLKSLSTDWKKYGRVLIYGAGGVAKDLMALLNPYADGSRTSVVVSKKQGNEGRLAGRLVRQIDEFTDAKEEALVILAVMPRLAGELRERARGLGFRNYMTAEEISKGLYEEIWQSGIRRDKIVFSSWSGGGFGGNAKYIALDLMRRSRDLDLVWALERKGMDLPDGIRGVLYGTYEHYRELGTAGIWIDNVHKKFFTRKREGQHYIQTWHGGGPLKKIEFDGENLPGSYLDLCEMDAGLADVMVSPSRFNSGLYRTAFRYAGEILECGYPRNDVFWQGDRCRRKMERVFQLGPEELMALYAPTFRDSRTGERNVPNLEGARRALEARFGRKCRMFARLHPSDAGEAKSRMLPGQCTDATSHGDVQELLAAADVLITDYSSVMWDFSLGKKPVFLYHPDVALYEKERGYYLPFEKMPYVEAFDDEDLRRKIEAFDEGRYREELRVFLEEYGSFDRGTAAEAVGNHVMGVLKGRWGRG